MKYLKDKSYYEELYDKGTVYQCRLTEKSAQKIKEEDVQKCIKLPKGYNKDGLHRYINDLILYFKTGDRYSEKESTIREWMEKDKERDDFYNQPEPLAYCPKCNKKMTLTFKHLEEKLETQKMRVLYLFKCEKCDQKRGVYDDGEPYVFKNDICPKCKTELEIKTRETKRKVTIKSNCAKCGYNNTRSYDLNEKPKDEETD